tara:strand:+ start:5 stop:694 length:690 start_codon:yes stop_codon:yes gene_type:complete
VSKLYVFGDSYSTPDFCVDPKDSWWGLLAKEHDLPVSNYSWPGNNIDSIQHIIVSSKDMFNKDDVVVIGIPPVERITTFEAGTPSHQVIGFDNTLTRISTLEIPVHQGLKQATTHEMEKSTILAFSWVWQEAKILKDMIILSHWLESVVSNHLIVNLSVPFQPPGGMPTISYLQQQVLENKKMTIFSDTYYSINENVHVPVDFDTFGWHGHHGPAGNKLWYDTALKGLL